jgi:hypothetical protein
MTLSNTTTRAGLIQDCETLTGLGDKAISGNTTRQAEFIRLLNVRYRMADTEIWKASNEWGWDDTNQTDLPVATTTLVDTQHDYSLPSTARKIERVEVKDTNGNWSLVYPIDKSQFTEEAMTEFEETDGIPKYYDMVGNSLWLYPAPDSSLTSTTSALRLYASRDIVAFSTTVNATTIAVSPGIDNHFHRYISAGASYDWALTKGLKKVPYLKQMVDEMSNDIKEFYGARHTDFGTRLGVKDMTNI